MEETPLALPGRPKTLRTLSIMPAKTPALPRKARRSQKVLILMQRLSSFPRNRGDAIDFNQRIPWKSRNGDGSSRRTPIREIGLEDFVHSVVVVDLCQINSELKNTVHGAATGFDQRLDIVHHLLGVGL